MERRVAAGSSGAATSELGAVAEIAVRGLVGVEGRGEQAANATSPAAQMARALDFTPLGDVPRRLLFNPSH